MSDDLLPTTDHQHADDDRRPPSVVGHRSAASAPAKLILCGEHAVVYGRPAIALPLAGIRARVEIADARAGSGIVVLARDLRRRWSVGEDPNNPLSELIANVLEYLMSHPLRPSPDLRITIRSTIPIASGMGSGAAVATALVRALTSHFGRELPPAEISALVYASEQRFHGTPSGIDNTVIAYEQPIWFVRQTTNDQRPTTKDDSPVTANLSSLVIDPSSDPAPAPIIEPIAIAAPFSLLIADTGVRSATRAPVGEVRRRWETEPARYAALFDQVGDLAARARVLLAQGGITALGRLLSENHALLQQIGVSSPELDALVAAAQGAGALGAKLSGAGWGGVMLALVTADTHKAVSAALKAAGARRVLESAIQPSQSVL